jgi:plastocyanin
MLKVPCRAIAALMLVVTVPLLASCGSDDNTSTSTATGASGSTFKVTGTDDLKFDPDTGTVPAGDVTITLHAEKAVNHDVVIEQLGTQPVVAAGAGQTKSGKVKLAAGTYTFYCNVPGHRQAGMEGTLTVS